MKIAKIILISAGGAALILLITIGICTQFYLTPEKVTPSLQAALQQHLKRKFSFSTMTVDLFTGIHIKDAVIHKSLPWETEDLLTCDNIIIKPALSGLLAQKLLIRDLTLVNATISLQFSRGKPVSFKGTRQAPQKIHAPLAVLLFPRNINLRKGQLIIHNTAKDTRLKLRDLKIDCNDISLLSSTDFVLSAVLQQAPDAIISCTGSFSLPQRKLSADLQAAAIPLDTWLPLLPANTPRLHSGSLSLTSQVRMHGKAPIDISTDITLDNAALTLMPATAPDNQTTLSPANAKLAFSAAYDLTKNLCTFKNIDGKILASAFSGSGSIQTTGSRSRLSFTVTAPQFSFDDLFARLQRGPTAPFKDMQLTGKAAIRLSISGNLNSRLSPSTIITFKHNPILYPPLGLFQPSLQGEVRVDTRTITLSNLTIGTPHLSITLGGDIKGYNTWPPRSNVRIISSHIDVKHLMNPAQRAGTNIGPFAFGSFRSSGPIRLGNTSFLGVPLKHVQGTYLFENNTLTIRDLQGEIEQGGFSLSAAIDLGVKGLDYHLLLKLNDAPFSSLLRMVNKAPQNIFKADVSGTCAFKGNGTSARDFLHNIKGDALFNFSDAQFRGLKLIPELSRFIKHKDLAQLDLEHAQLQLRLRKSITDVDGSFINPLIELHPTGEVYLDSTLDLETKLNIAPAIFNSSMPLAPYLPQEDGKVSLSLTVGGTLKKPDVSLQKQTMDYLIKESLPKLLMDLLSEREDTPIAEMMEQLTGTLEEEDDDDEAEDEPSAEDEVDTEGLEE
ncbi:MAG: DUF748 domain-containing protein [Deltaproteobacteria bacterium]|nr:DUF748 domain-containing protein [Deltaproteobacteria bacterium]